jgi:HEAT repeat protein
MIVCLGLAVRAPSPASARASTADSDPSTHSQLEARVDELREVLRQPLHWSEGNTLFRFLARWISRRDAEPQLRAIRELTLLESPSATAAIGFALLDPGFPYRVDAALALERAPRIEALSFLLETLDADDPALRGIVAGVIGTLVGEKDLPFAPEAMRNAETALARMLAEDADPRVRLAALDGLVMLNTEAAAHSAFVIGNKDPDGFVRCGLVARSRHLVKGGREGRITVRMIREFLHSRLSETSRLGSLGIAKRARYAQKYYSQISKQPACVDIEEAAMRTLAILRDPTALPNLLSAASSDIASLRASAAGALANYKDDAALAAVGTALVDPMRGVRQAAIIGLGESHDPRADSLLVFTLQESAPVDRRDAAKALGGAFGASSALIRAFADRAVQIRNEAEAALLRSDEIVVRLEAARFALDNEVQTHANAEQLERRRRRLEEGYERWMTERRESEVALAAGLASPDVRVRIRSARVLARYRSPESLELLRESLRSGLSPESEVAALALGLRGDPDARIDLESASRLEHTPLAVAAIRALQDLGRSESLPLLRSIRQSDARDRVRTAAGYAVAMIETKPSP